MKKYSLVLLFLSRLFISLFFFSLVSFSAVADTSARDIIEAAMNHWRGTTSYSDMVMTIHRKDWERTMQMRAWTEGEESSLVRVVEPKADAGSGSLMKGNNLWTFAPKINRVIKIPSSMMNQGWMGSDFSNRDISRSTEVVNSYSHTLKDTVERDGHRFFVIESVPNEEAAVVWGKEVYTIRDDNVLVKQEFWDQTGELIKVMEATKIREMGGRMVASTLRIGKVEAPQEWTEMQTLAIEFDLTLDANLFTLSSLRNPRMQQ